MSSSTLSIPQVQPQEQPSNCSHHLSTAGGSQASSHVFASVSGGGHAVQRQGSSPIKVQTKGRFTIIEEEGSSPKLSFKLPSFGGSLSGQKSTAAAGASTTGVTPATPWWPADVKAASTPGLGTTKSAHMDFSCYQPPSSSKMPAAGALQMPGAT